MLTKEYINIDEKYGTHNYHPLEIVIQKRERI